MWKVKGAVRYFLSILATTFVQMGVFVYAQKILSGSFTNAESGQTWQTFMLQIFFIAPYVLMIWPAGFFTNRFSKNKILAWSSLLMTAFVIAQTVLVTCNFPRIAFWLSIGLSCGFAIHSTAKYAIVREMFGVHHLSYANAFLQIFSLIGIIIAGWLAIVGVNLIDLSAVVRYEAVGLIIEKSVVIPWILTGVSVLGTIASFLIPKVRYEDKNVVLFDRLHQFGLCRRLGCNGNAKAVAEHRGVGNGHIQVADLGPQQARHVGGREDLAVACGHLELVEHRKHAFDVGALERLYGKARQAGLYLNAKTALQ